VRKADTKSESLNLLEPSGPLRACNGTALPFTILVKKKKNPHLEFITTVYSSDRTVSAIQTVIIYREGTRRIWVSMLRSMFKIAESLKYKDLT
jgi:hypothetical protein